MLRSLFSPLLSLSFLLLLAACSKELSFENNGIAVGPGGGTAEAGFAGSPGRCDGIEVFGAYPKGVAVDSGNYLVAVMDVTKEGTYGITSDTINGIYFSGTGSFGVIGAGVIKLAAKGKPVAEGTFTYTLRFKGSTCFFNVNVADAVVAPAGDYFPTTAQSFWRYRSSDPQSTAIDTIYITSTGQQQSFSGQTYTRFNTLFSGDTTGTFYRKGSGSYYEYTDLDLLGISETVVAGEYIFLKDNVARGTQWFSPEGTGSVGGQEFKIRIKMELMEKDVTASVGGKTYVNVIKMKYVQQAQLTAGAWTDVLTLETWFAKGIGTINVVLPEPAYGYSLTSFSVR